MLPGCCNLINELQLNKKRLQDWRQRSVSIRRGSRPSRQDTEGITAEGVEAMILSRATAGAILIMA